jgi:hypothetical protein
MLGKRRSKKHVCISRSFQPISTFFFSLDTVLDHSSNPSKISVFLHQLGTGCFILYNTGNDLAYSRNGLLTTVAYKWNDDDPVYALEVKIS